MTAATDRKRQATADAVAASIRRGGPNWKPLAFQGLLLVLLLSSMVILVALIADIAISAWPTFQSRGLSFITSGLSLNPETAGVLTGIIGSLVIAGIVVVGAGKAGAGMAAAVEQSGNIKVGIELNDVNYPGCLYTLVHDAALDQLRGQYFQAGSGQTYEVAFVRMPAE